MRWRSKEPGSAVRRLLVAEAVSLVVSLIALLVTGGETRSAPRSLPKCSSTAGNETGQGSTPSFAVDNLSGLQWVETRTVEASTGTELSHARAVVNTDTCDMVAQVTGPNNRVLGETAIVRGVVATRKPADATWSVGTLTSATAPAAAPPAATTATLAEAAPTAALPSVWDIPVDSGSGLSLVLDSNAVAGRQGAPSFVPNSRLRWSRWWRDGHLAAEEVAGWIPGANEIPKIDIIESRTFTPINDNADVLTWADEVGIPDLASGWNQLESRAAEPYSGSTDLLGFAVWVRNFLPADMNVEVSNGALVMEYTGELTPGTVIYEFKQLEMAKAIAILRLAFQINSLIADITVPPAITAPIQKPRVSVPASTVAPLPSGSGSPSTGPQPAGRTTPTRSTLGVDLDRALKAMVLLLAVALLLTIPFAFAAVSSIPAFSSIPAVSSIRDQQSRRWVRHHVTTRVTGADAPTTNPHPPPEGTQALRIRIRPHPDSGRQTLQEVSK
jgi:hypothetical protein